MDKLTIPPQFGFVTISSRIDGCGRCAATQASLAPPLRSPPDYDGSDNTRRVVYVGTNSLQTGDDSADGIYRVAAASREAGTLPRPIATQKSRTSPSRAPSPRR